MAGLEQGQLMAKITRRQWLACAAAPAVIWAAGPKFSHANEPWQDQSAAGPFLCHANFRLGDYQPLFAELAQVQLDLMRTLGLPPCREPVELYLFSDKKSYRAYLKLHFPQVPYRRALFVKRSGPGMVFAHLNDEFAVDLRHESTHALLHGVLPMVPLWLDEGLAEYFEVSADQRAYGNPHLASVKWGVRLGLTPKLKTLEEKRDLSEMGRPEYRYSWAWVHYMLHGSPAAHQELVRFFTDIQAQTPPGRLSERLEARVAGVDAQLAQHFKAWKK